MNTIRLGELLDALRLRLGDECMLESLAISLSSDVLSDALYYIARNNNSSDLLDFTIDPWTLLNALSVAIGDRWLLFELFKALPNELLEKHFKRIADYYELSYLYASNWEFLYEY